MKFRKKTNNQEIWEMMKIGSREYMRWEAIALMVDGGQWPLSYQK